MAYYAALVSVEQLLDQEMSRVDDQNFLGRNYNNIIRSLYQKIGLLMASLKDYESKGDEATDFLERRIRDAAYKAQDMIEESSQISNDDIHPKDDESTHGADRDYLWEYEKGNVYQDLRKVEEEIDLIVEELRMRIKRGYTSNEDHPQPQHSSYADIMDHFDIRVWVTVTQHYHFQNLLRTILNSITGVISKHHVGEEELVGNIYRLLKGRSYLIIMDDVWSTTVWDDLKRVFLHERNGSRIILTTRLLDVANYVSNFGSLHQMQFLNEEQSWNLLREKVFAVEDCPPELEDSGKSIANSCGGLPLAIIVVAGVLSKVSRTRYDWEYFAVNASSILMSADGQLRRLQSLSYNGLPHHLKPCLLYVGVFPEKYEISVSRLIKLWVAEGFLRPIRGETLEEAGKRYLDSLVDRNLVLITAKRSDGKIKSCSIQNPLRELCREIACHENFFHVSNENGYFFPEGRNSVRRSCLYSSDMISISADNTSSDVRSVFCFEHPQGLLSFVSSLKLLRVLDALGMIFTSFPVEILKLFHLRYLALRLCTIHTIMLPPSISKLQSLQTIVVEGFISLPSQIWTMPQLRHVLISNINLSPFDVGKVHRHVLENLQTLLTVENFRFSNNALESVPNLKKLKVRCAEYKSYSTWKHYCLNNLVQLCQLEKLEIVFLPSDEPKSLEPFPESFAFPVMLTKLSLRGCKLPWKDMTVLGSLPNLEILKLLRNAVLGEEWEPIEGEFLQLNFLVMEDLDLKDWRAGYVHFPCLEHLEIRHCKNLVEIPLAFGESPTLQFIKVCGSKSGNCSTTPIQEEQESYGNDDLQVRVCHSYNFW